MSELGNGCRVWIGYTDSYAPGYEITRMKTGTIISGAYPLTEGGKTKTYFTVETDIGIEVSAWEGILFPIDDDEEEEDDSVVQGQPEESACN